MTAQETQPLLSIIIPAYNAAGWLRRAIDSALAQTYRPIEILVVDDGSTDGTADVCRTYADRVRYIRQEHAGVSAARNCGITRSGGSIIGFLDADDELLPEMVSVLLGPLLRYPEAGAASGAHWMERTQENLREPAQGQVLPQGLAEGLVEDFFDTYSRFRLVCIGSVLVRRPVFDDVGGFREDMHFGEDQEMWARIAGRYPWAFVDREVAVYHNLPASSATIRSTAPRLPNWVYTDEEMKRLVRPELWNGYRRYRQNSVLAACRTLLCQGATREVRKSLPVLGDGPKTADWRIVEFLAHLPGPLARALSLGTVALKKVLRTRASRARRTSPPAQ